MDFSSLNPETKAALSTCENPEDYLALAKAEGYELSDEELEQIAGGAPGWLEGCPSEQHIGPLIDKGFENGNFHYVCEHCGTNLWMPYQLG